MQLRGANNAATVPVAAVAFVLTGSVVVACGAAGGFDADDIKFGIITYLCLAGPLFLASLSAVGLSKHKSFRATVPPYMEGKRVKRRLWWLATTCSSIAITSMIGAWACLIWAGCRFEFLAGRQAWVPIVVLGTPVLAYALTYITFAVVSVWFGWATRQEAGQLLTKGRRWPDTWLEPVPKIKNCLRAQPRPGK